MIDEINIAICDDEKIQVLAIWNSQAQYYNEEAV